MAALKGFVTLDIETTITEYLGRTASPFTSENWVVQAGWAVGKAAPQERYWGYDRDGSKGFLAELLRTHNPQYLVGFNIKFDLLHLLRFDEDYQEWMRWVADGGQLWDSQLAEYLLEGQDQQAQFISLDETAPRYGGNVKIDEVKALWAAGVNTPDIPRQLLTDYLIGRDGEEGDIGNTRLVFLGQTAAAKKAGQVRSIQLNNGALIAAIEMERNGLHVNVELGLRKAAQLTEEVAALRKQLHAYLPVGLPFEFNWGSPKQKSALIFGGRIKYPARAPVLDEHGKQAYAQMEVVGYWLHGGQLTAAEPTPETEQHYVKVLNGLKAGQYKTKKIKVDDPSKPKSRIEEFFFNFPGFTKPKPEWEGADKGYYSTKAENIEELAGRGIPFLDAFADLTDKVKDLGTYYLTQDEDDEGNPIPGTQKGMLAMVHPDGLVHANIGMTATITGRLAHSKPNISNLPRKDTSEVKQMFESRFGPAGDMVQSDFTSLEIYMQALLSKDKQLIADLQAGLDMHVKRLTQVHGRPYAELLDLIKVQKDKSWVLKRTLIKVFSFQRAYGAGAPKIARFLKVSQDDVEGWIAADEALYPGVTAWQDRVGEYLKQHRIPTGSFVTHPTAKVPLQLGIAKYRTFDGKVYTFREHASPDFMVKRGQLQGFSPTERKNYPVQGLGGEWMKAAMWLAVRAFYKYRNFGGLALLVNTVHDALYADVHSSVRRKAGVLIHASMLAASDLMGWWFDTPIPTPVPAETTYGPSMYVEESFDDPALFAQQAERTRQWLRTTFMNQGA